MMKFRLLSPPEQAFRGGFMGRVSLLGEFLMFLRENKKLWLLPIVITLVLLGTLLVFAQSSALAPFIYTIF
jgi:hypothetical protein